MHARLVRIIGLLTATASTAAMVLILEAGSAGAMQNSGGGDNGITCQRVSVGLWYCTVYGKGYYCTRDHPQPDDCFPAHKTNINRFPTSPKAGTLKNQ